MPSEVVIPGLTFIVLLLLAFMHVVLALLTTINMLADSLGTYSYNLSKLGDKIEIVDVDITVIDNNTLFIMLLVVNRGSNPIYQMDKCDLIIEYTTLTSTSISTRLRYRNDWYVEYVLITENYAIPFNERGLIGSGEIGVIKAVFRAIDVDLSKPLRIVFVSHYGAKDYRWVVYSAQH